MPENEPTPETTAVPGYREMTAEFEDFAGDQVRLSFQFKKPKTADIERALKDITKSPTRGLRNLLIPSVHPDERAGLIQALDEHPGLVTAFGNEMLERLGFNSLGK